MGPLRRYSLTEVALFAAAAAVAGTITAFSVTVTTSPLGELAGMARIADGSCATLEHCLPVQVRP